MSLRTYVLNFNDITKEGLTLTFAFFSKVGVVSQIPSPTIEELNLGFYKFSFDIDSVGEDVYYVVTDGGTNLLTGTIPYRSVESLTDIALRNIGLCQENQFIDQMNYDGNNSLLSARLRTYESSADVGTDNNVLATYQINSSYVGTALESFACEIVS